MSWTYQTKNSESISYLAKSGVLIYLVSENGDYYLIGENQDEFLVTQDPFLNWSGINKNSANWSYQTKN